MSDHWITVLSRIHEQLAGSPEEYRRKFRALPEIERDLHAVQMFHGEVVRGGFATFFGNSAGRWHWRETLGALQRMDADKPYQLLRRACGLFPGGSPPDDSETFEEQAGDESFQEQVNALPLDEGEVWLAMQAYCDRHFPAPPDWKPPPPRDPVAQIRQKVQKLTAQLRSGNYGPPSLYALLSEKGIDWRRSVLLNSYVDSCGCHTDDLLDQQGRLVEFEIQLSEAGEIVSVDRWSERVLTGEWWNDGAARKRPAPSPSDPIVLGLAMLAQP